MGYVFGSQFVEAHERTATQQLDDSHQYLVFFLTLFLEHLSSFYL
jgi:hypothetical protein